MFQKILIANRGEIAVRIIRTCREMGIQTIAAYEAEDLDSLHLRIADECIELETTEGFNDQEAIIKIAIERGAQAIHPGYGFLADRAEFCRACENAGLVFIGPPARVIQIASDKVEALKIAEAVDIPTIPHSKGCIEKAISNSHIISIDLLADRHGKVVHLPDHESSICLGNQKWLIESPAPCLSQDQRKMLFEMSERLARLYQVENLVTFEFILDGRIYFSEMKARIRMEYSLTEMMTRLDLVREQIRIASGEQLGVDQADIYHGGCGLQCQVMDDKEHLDDKEHRAEDPSHSFFPCPGQVRQVRFPGGQDVRVDSYAYSGCSVPVRYDPLIAKLVVWGPDRQVAMKKMAAALEEFLLIGPPTNLVVLQQILQDARIITGSYSTDFKIEPFSWRNGDIPATAGISGAPIIDSETMKDHLRDLAIASAIYYLRRNQFSEPVIPPRINTNWHRRSRQLP